MPPLPSVIVPRSVVVVVGSVVVGAVAVVEVVVVLVGGAVVVEDAVDDVLTVEEVLVEVEETEDELVVPSSPLSAETTASATPRPITAATSTAISALTAPLIPERGGS